MLDPDKAQEIAERDQLWASLRSLRPEIEPIAAAAAAADRRSQVVALLARIVLAELDYRARDADLA